MIVQYPLLYRRLLYRRHFQRAGKYPARKYMGGVPDGQIEVFATIVHYIRGGPEATHAGSTIKRNKGQEDKTLCNSNLYANILKGYFLNYS